ncbi:MAG: DUF4302 domain-containing protein [Mangrovibacterium sp.]
MKKYIYLFMALIAFSCSEDDRIFDQESTERIAETLTEYNELLLSSANGWKMQYFPDPDRLGGYNFLFKFEEDNRVVSQSDFNNSERESSYKLYDGQGAILSFDSYSLLHILADPGANPVGTGYGGEFELVIERSTADSLICKGRKWKQPMILTRATAEDWAGMDEIKANEMILAPVTENMPFFRNLRVGGNGIATFLYEYTNRFVEYYYNDEKGDTQSGLVGIVFSRHGFSLEHEININGTLLKDFKLDASKQFYTFGENGTITIDHYSSVEFKDAWDSFYKIDGSSLSRSSLDFYSLFEDVQELEPGFATLQVYWNMSNLKLFSFVFVESSEEASVTKWYHSVIGNIDSPGEDNVTFHQRLDDATGLPLVLTNIADNQSEIDRLFYEENESSARIQKITDFFYDPEGFTVIPNSGGATFYLISKSRSNYWLLFTAY